MILGRTDLRIGVSRAKFDDECDFEVRLAVAPQKRHEELIFRSEIFVKRIFSASKIVSFGNRPKRVLAKFRGDPSHVRAVTKQISPQSSAGN